MSAETSSRPAESPAPSAGAARDSAPETPRMVLGTAGHIDHGKTSLIRALTGVDTDRLPEEKARGITIDLGFAALDLGDGQQIAVVDVPGHEKLVRTMVSGAAGIDLVLLVVAADEGVMPQTREHVAICDLLGVERGVVALTKCDLVDEEMQELAGEEVKDLLETTALAGTPMVAVSCESGEGIEALRDTLRELIRTAEPRTPRRGPARLGIDRVFAMRGFGTVVTGTLLGDSIRVGESLEIHPRGSKVRVRGLQNHGEAVEQADPGARCAINLQGVEVADLSRGDVVAGADSIVSTRSADLLLSWLEGAPPVEGPVSVEFLTGTAERRARLAPIASEGFAPGETGFARLHVDPDGDPIPLLPGDRFIVRGFARIAGAGGTFGGGKVLDVAPPHRRRSDPALARELEILSQGDVSAGLRERVVRAGMAGIEATLLGRETGIDRATLRAELELLEEAGDCVAAGGERWLASAAVERMEASLLASLDTFHRSEPLRPGMSRGALRGRLANNVHGETADLALERLELRGEIAIESKLVRLADHTPTLDSEAKAAVDRICAEAREAGLEPASARDWSERLGISAELFRDLVAHLEREKKLVRAPGDMWFDSDAIAELRGRVTAHFESHEELDTRAYKDLIGTTRRTAMPLMELLDDLHVTRRVGDVRVLRKR